MAAVRFSQPEVVLFQPKIEISLEIWRADTFPHS